MWNYKTDVCIYGVLERSEERRVQILELRSEQQNAGSGERGQSTVTAVYRPDGDTAEMAAFSPTTGKVEMWVEHC